MPEHTPGPCGCKATPFPVGPPLDVTERCSLHDAAPALLDFAQLVVLAIDEVHAAFPNPTAQQRHAIAALEALGPPARAAIAKAKGTADV